MYWNEFDFLWRFEALLSNCKRILTSPLLWLVSKRFSYSGYKLPWILAGPPLHALLKSFTKMYRPILQRELLFVVWHHLFSSQGHKLNNFINFNFTLSASAEEQKGVRMHVSLDVYHFRISFYFTSMFRFSYMWIHRCSDWTVKMKSSINVY